MLSSQQAISVPVAPQLRPRDLLQQHRTRSKAIDDSLLDSSDEIRVLLRQNLKSQADARRALAREKLATVISEDAPAHATPAVPAGAQVAQPAEAQVAQVAQPAGRAKARETNEAENDLPQVRSLSDMAGRAEARGANEAEHDLPQVLSLSAQLRQPSLAQRREVLGDIEVAQEAHAHAGSIGKQCLYDRSMYFVRLCLQPHRRPTPMQHL